MSKSRLNSQDQNNDKLEEKQETLPEMKSPTNEVKAMIDLVHKIHGQIKNIPVNFYHSSRWKKDVAALKQTASDFIKNKGADFIESKQEATVEQLSDIRVSFLSIVQKARTVISYELETYQHLLQNGIDDYIAALLVRNEKLIEKIQKLEIIATDNARSRPVDLLQKDLLILEKDKKIAELEHQLELLGINAKHKEEKNELEKFKASTLTTIGNLEARLPRIPKTIEQVFSLQQNGTSNTSPTQALESTRLQIQGAVNVELQQINETLQNIPKGAPVPFNKNQATFFNQSKANTSDSIGSTTATMKNGR
ncbi:MAG TPA: hypothetical protein VHA13_01110 [Gammaproteobacteria bacterium]|nr:hypothetical protein [Gammaproteobacteria bacterium]